MPEIDDAAASDDRRVPSGAQSCATAEITELLGAWRAGDAEAGTALMECVYGELRSLAAVQLGRVGSPSWQPTELVHELYLKLTDRREALSFVNRAHFFGVMARLLRDLTIDRVRHHRRLKRGGATVLVCLDADVVAQTHVDPSRVDLLALDRALARLEQVHAGAAQLVELRFFAGLTIPETAAVLGVDRSTVGRTWRYAKAWLRQALEQSAPTAGGSQE